MAHAYYHAKSSVRKFGGKVEDYVEIHEFLDSTKSAYADIRHRAVLHNTFGVFIAEKVFGRTLVRKSDKKEIPLRPILEQHIVEDCGKIPTLENWLDKIPLKPFMVNAKPLSEN